MGLRKCETWKKCGDLDLGIFKCGDLDLDIFAVLVMDFEKFWKSPNPSVGYHFLHIFIRIYLTHSHWNWVMHASVSAWTVSLFETIACHLIDSRPFSKPMLMVNSQIYPWLTFTILSQGKLDAKVLLIFFTEICPYDWFKDLLRRVSITGRWNLTFSDCPSTFWLWHKLVISAICFMATRLMHSVG